MRRLRERYELKAPLGEGGQGTVWRAFDHQHRRDVAVKIRPAAGAERQALLAEARTLLELRPHPNLPLVREDFFADEDYVLVMDWVEGHDLAQVVAERGDPGLALSVAVDYLSLIHI